jgi:hypothetical protein
MTTDSRKANDQFLAEIAGRKCQSCHDYGYRIHWAPYSSINVKGAERSGISGRKVPCQCCGAPAAVAA